MSNDAVLKALAAITTSLQEVQQRLDALEAVVRPGLEARATLDEATKTADENRMDQELMSRNRRADVLDDEDFSWRGY